MMFTVFVMEVDGIKVIFVNVGWDGSPQLSLAAKMEGGVDGGCDKGAM